MSKRGHPIDTVDAPQMPHLFSQAVVHRSTVYTAGVVGLNPFDMTRPDEFSAEVDQVINNLAAVLSAAGASLETVVKTTCFLTSRELYSEFNECYARRFDRPLPARSVVFCELVANLRVEIEVVAAITE
ncbi:2-iminobutanoate/2-iminopropanoate deaminase [Prauserella sediminis]|uniref:2-iminobutanoate/2-iminopropanoate deaminase n=1 Tax=Prauserella sediminis TaxID=577680 RepID=A0A839XKV5_9PSEU|nr:RidA family protein [Prauserella sediminis]MBB3664532.1 2-iminobutanoate/2-iminopropanoate deaminase [Prauserella sediminis]